MQNPDIHNMEEGIHHHQAMVVVPPAMVRPGQLQFKASGKPQLAMHLMDPRWLGGVRSEEQQHMGKANQHQVVLHVPAMHVKLQLQQAAIAPPETQLGRAITNLMQSHEVQLIQ